MQGFCRNTVIPASTDGTCSHSSIRVFLLPCEQKVRTSRNGSFFLPLMIRWWCLCVPSSITNYSTKIFSLYHFVCHRKCLSSLFHLKQPSHTSESRASFFVFTHLPCQWLFCSSSFKFMTNQLIKLECYLPLMLKYMQQSGYSWQWLAHQWAAWKQTETLREEKILDSCCIHFKTFEVLEHWLLPSEARCSLK